MIPVELVQWGGVAGSGFSPVDDGALRRAPGPFRSAAQELVHVPDGVPQPTPDLEARSALGLRVVPVPGAGSWWCFSVQVCGGRFGRTGVCQFLFAPLDGTEAWRLWEGCVAAVHAGDGLLPWALASSGLPADPAPLGGSADTGTVAQVLTGLVEEHDAVRVGGAETGVAAAIAGALRVLPHAVTRERVWTTFLAATPGNPRLRRVTGPWPEPLRGTPTAERVDRWLDGKLAALSVADDGDDAAAVRWLAGHVREPAAVDRYRSLPTIGALVASVVENELWRLGFDQVWPAMLRGDERVLRPENEPQLISWLIGNAPRAVEWLCGTAAGLADEFADTVFGLLARKVPEGLGLPTTDPVWFDRSVELARRRWPAVADRVAFARSVVVADVRELGPWFTALGLDRHDPDLADLFPVSFEDVVDEVAGGGDLGPLSERFLATPASAETLVRLVEAVPPLSPAVAVSWVRRVGAESERRQVFRAVLGRHRFAGQASAWLLAALESTEDDEVRDVVASLGAGAFGGKEQPSLELALVCTEIAARSAEPANGFAVYLDVVGGELEQRHDREAELTEAVHRLEQDYRALFDEYKAAEKRRRSSKPRKQEAEEPVEQETEESRPKHAVDYGRRVLLWRNVRVTALVLVVVLVAVALAVFVDGMFH
ncbi:MULTISPECIES: hypothetical protein [unclassified Saccharothrix]|uniref:hypothetical protein n=1 Tax=unclassified Saccharothrix TaxID=2593673 RepID=UPI00307EEFF1